jgi:hypothetical protein
VEFTKAKPRRLQARTDREVKSHFNISVPTSEKTQWIYITEIEMLREIIAVYSENARKIRITVFLVKVKV